VKNLGLAVLSSLLVGCPAEDPPQEEENTGGNTTEEATSEPTTTSPTSTTPTTSTSTSEGSSSGSGVDGIPASGGMRIDFIEANQGIGVKIGENGRWVGPEGRTAPLVARRVTLVRVFWTVPDDWQPREIEGRITFYLPDGTTVNDAEVKMVNADSFVGSLDDSFNFGLLAEQALPGVGYSVELYEVDPAFEDPTVTAPPRLPEQEESVLVGVEDSWQKLKVVIVPFNYDNGGNCVTEPDLTESTMQLYYDKMLQMNPIDTLEIEIHDTLDWNTPLESLGEINSLLSDLRFEEGAPPETYYYGHIDVCAGGIGGAAGLAHGIPNDPTMENAYQRVSTGVSYDPELSAETFVHEVGHSQGRSHIACNGEEGGPDPTYPNEGGDIGEWGFGVVDYMLRHPTATKDYMTYCTPTWVSNFGWNKVYPTIRTLSMWDPEYPGNGAPGADADPYKGSLLVGMLLPSGKEIWHTVPGTVPEHELTDDTQIEFSIGGEVLARQRARVTEIPDSSDLLVVTPLPEGFDAVDTISRIDAEGRVTFDRARVKLSHHARTIER
jgi:hypothetical protein